jgi:DNA (cytosine-5)-methyltransferase 1
VFIFVGMKHIGLFEGIGGFSLAARWMGWETIAWCEWNEFGQKVLRHHFPEAEGFGDITKTDFTKYANKIDILTGGFPCQPYSLAGKRKGKEDERHLWPEMLRAIREIQPSWVVGENVFGLVNWSEGLVFHEVQADLEAQGYEVWAYVLPACAVNAPHRRDRVWFVAYSRHNSERKAGNSTGNERQEFATIHKEGQGRKWEAVFNNGLCDLQGDATNTDRNDERLLCRPKPEQGFEAYSFNSDISRHGDATNTVGKGLERYNEWERCSVNRNNEGLQFRSENKQPPSNSDCGRQSCQEYRKEKPGRVAETSIPKDWSNFPTQSPICSGDDGLPSQLDGITFPKWRNESIKAYGNAIVPQVAYEIFKAINKYNNLK